MEAQSINKRNVLTLIFSSYLKAKLIQKHKKKLLQKTAEVKLFINFSCAQTSILFKSVMCNMRYGMEVCQRFPQAVYVLCLLVLMPIHFSATLLHIKGNGRQNKTTDKKVRKTG